VVPDPDNKAYYRKCRCTKCGRQFFTVEFEIECDKDIFEAFEYATPPSKSKVESSKRRFEEFRKTKKRVQQMQRSGVK
jgi:hypothetical protein